MRVLALIALALLVGCGSPKWGELVEVTREKSDNWFVESKRNYCERQFLGAIGREFKTWDTLTAYLNHCLEARPQTTRTPVFIFPYPQGPSVPAPTPPPAVKENGA